MVVIVAIDLEFCPNCYPTPFISLWFPNMPTLHVLVERMKESCFRDAWANRTFMFMRPSGEVVENDNQLQAALHQQEDLHALLRAE